MQEQAEEPDREAPYLLYDAVKQTLGGLAATPRADATPTGVGAFDVTVGGFVTGEVMAISGPRASGKTRFACELAAAVAVVGYEQEALPRAGVLYVTNHASAADLAQRLICTHADLSPESVRSGELGESEWDRFFEVGDLLSQQPLWIDDRPFDSLDQLVERVRSDRAVIGRSTAPTHVQLRLLVVDDLAADRASIQTLRTLVIELGWSALVILRGEEQLAPERLGADSYIVLRRVHAQIQPVLTHSRHRRACLIPMAWPAEPEGLATDMDDDLRQLVDVRRRFRFAYALAHHLRAVLSDFYLQIDWGAIAGRHKGWPPDALIRIAFEDETPVIELTAEIVFTSLEGLCPLDASPAGRRWSTPFTFEAPFTRRTGVWFVDRIRSIVGT